jgi:hypothetical protein
MNNVRIILFLLASSAFTPSHAQPLTMADIPLTWKDFTKTSSLPEPRAAHIALNTKYEWESITKPKEIVIEYKATLTQVKANSKVKSEFLRKSGDIRKEELLNHEKGHYIVALLKQYWLQDTLQKVKLSERNYKQELRTLQQAIETRAEQLNQTYDKETYHSTNKEKQSEWEERLLNMLRNYAANASSFPYKVSYNLIIPKI